MKIVITLITVSLVVLGALTYNVIKTVDSINETTDLLREYTNASNQAALLRERQVQDTLEERITILENKIEDLEFNAMIKGKK